VTQDLKATLEAMVAAVFGDVEMRWVEASFPFTTPSLELEIMYGGEWLEVLGCGNVHPEILQRAGYEIGRDGPGGWAFGLGLERLAMVLFGIPDIRLFWTQDERFLSQFRAGQTERFAPYSKFPPCYKDVSFWIEDEAVFHENDVHEIARGVAGDLCECVEPVDEFVHPESGRRSLCFRINFRSMDRSLINEEVDALQTEIRARIAAELPVTLR
jgi:phenylalanyl-tRNA synthetase alpha chain